MYHIDIYTYIDMNHTYADMYIDKCTHFLWEAFFYGSRVQTAQLLVRLSHHDPPSGAWGATQDSGLSGSEGLQLPNR